MKSNKSYIVNALYEWIVDNDCTPYLLVKSDYRGVDIPQELAINGQIVFNISMTATSKLVLDKTLISFDAIFKGEKRSIHVPMGAIIGIYAQENGEGMMFDISREKPDVDGPIDSVQKEKSRPTLRIVK